MLVKKGFDFERHVLNCDKGDARFCYTKIKEKGYKILGINVCNELQALVYDEYEVDIRYEKILD